jgi:ABC-type multidrug transport system fused ATPase/permease subunit
MSYPLRDIPGAKNFRSGPGGIRFEAVGFRYRNQSRPIFRALSLKIAPGEKVALVGESGSAKALSPNFSSAPMAWTRAAL